jgi:tRNA A37 methylthiotransferase MiaB
VVSVAAERTRVAAPVRTAAIANLGCKVNQAEMEGAARLLRERGIAIVDGRERADLVLVNTCTVTSEADAKSRHAVRRARRTSPDASIVVTGCSVQIGREAFAAADPAARAELAQALIRIRVAGRHHEGSRRRG